MASSSSSSPVGGPAESTPSPDYAGLLGAARDGAGLVAIFEFLLASISLASASSRAQLLSAARAVKEAGGSSLWTADVAQAFGRCLRAWTGEVGAGEEEAKDYAASRLYVFGKAKHGMRKITDLEDFSSVQELVDLTYGSTGGFCVVERAVEGGVYTFHSDGVWRIDLETQASAKVSGRNFGGYLKVFYWDGYIYAFGKARCNMCKINPSDFDDISELPLQYGSSGGFCVVENFVYTFHSDGVWRIDMSTLESTKMSSQNWGGYMKIFYWGGSIYATGKGGASMYRIDPNNFADATALPSLKYGSTGGFVLAGDALYTFHSDGVWRIDMPTLESAQMSSQNWGGYMKALCVG